jgi:hypothetical protein
MLNYYRYYQHFIEPEASLSCSVLTIQDLIQMSTSLGVFMMVTDSDKPFFYPED